MEDRGGKDCFVYLSKNPIKFDPSSKVTNVFFDESNEQIFTVRSGGVTGVKVQGPKEDLCHSFRMPDKGPVVSMKLSRSQNVLAIQRSKTSLEFINLKDGELGDSEYSQGSKNKNAVIYGFVWTLHEEIVIVTDQGVELFQVLPEKKCLKALKNITLNINWFVSCPAAQLIILASTPSNASIQPVSFVQSGALNKLPKFQIDIPVSSVKGTLLERNVTVTRLYGNTCILVLRHPCRTPGSSLPGAQFIVYTIHKVLQTTRKTHILNLEPQLECNGRFALSVIDNLIVVHHQVSCSSLLFDIGTENEGSDPITMKSITAPKSIRPYLVTPPGQESFHCQLYSANWVVFQPNIIIDAKLGLLWYVEIDVPMLCASGPPPDKLVDFLLRRRPDTTLPLLLKVLEDITDPVLKNRKNLKQIGLVFDMINAPYRKHLNMLAESQIATPASFSIGNQSQTKETGPDKIVIDQNLTYTHIFSKYPEKKNLKTYDGELAIKIILEYIRSLSDAQIPVQELNKLLITCLFEEEHGLSRLHHLLQYRVLADSKPLACTLLSLENIYPPAIQLSLDMLKRLGNADDEIIEILLHKQLILPTLRFARSVGLADQIPARKFLEAAQATNNPTIFYSVYKFFEQRNLRLKGTPHFAKRELCQPFTEHFKLLFSEGSSGNTSKTPESDGNAFK